MSRKYLNFDLDTKALQEWYPDGDWHNAYMDIRRYLEEHGFEHRQGSGYISRKNLNLLQATVIVQRMAREYLWLQPCLKELDVTNVGKTVSLNEAVSYAYDERMQEIMTSQKRRLK